VLVLLPDGVEGYVVPLYELLSSFVAVLEQAAEVRIRVRMTIPIAIFFISILSI